MMITVSNVVNATRGQLLCITYELLLEKIELARQKEGQERKVEAKKAIDIVQMLAGDLDFNVAISRDLFRIYVYVQGLLIQSKDLHKLEEAYRLIEKIYVGFKEAVKQEEMQQGKAGTPSIQNAEVIYAGMTYGKGNLNEISLGSNNRGFEA